VKKVPGQVELGPGAQNTGLFQKGVRRAGSGSGEKTAIELSKQRESEEGTPRTSFADMGRNEVGVGVKL